MINGFTHNPSTKGEENKASPPAPQQRGSKASPPTPLQGERGVVCFVGLLVEQLTSLLVDELIRIAIHAATKHLA